MSVNQIITAIGFIGLGGLLKSLLDFFIGARKTKQDAQLAFKEVRYKAIMLLCYSYAYYERENQILLQKRPDIDSFDKLRNELTAELINMALYGSKNVIIRFKEFIMRPNDASLSRLAITMRRDLYGVRGKPHADDLIANYIET